MESGELALHLQVPIPLQSSWLGEVSPACASMLSGLFELRPSLRLGGRNISALKAHAWLREKGVDDWQALENKTLAPFFRPGKVRHPAPSYTLFRLLIQTLLRLLFAEIHQGRVPALRRL